jgi:NAD(P)-dependent dehydrogenase (short-subunit alcohol dehydrogenase family)
MRLEHEVAVVTGCYGGMGRASVRLFAKEARTAVLLEHS